MADETRQSQQGGDNSENYQAGRDIIVNVSKSGDSQTEPAPPDPKILSELRQNLITASNSHELRKGLYALEAQLASNPNDTEARLLRDQYVTALENQVMHFEPLPRYYSARSPLTGCLLLALVAVITAFLVAYLMRGYGLWLSLLLGALAPFAVLLCGAIIGMVAVGVGYVRAWWRDRKSK